MLNAQRIENTASYRQPQSDKYFRILYDNDYFTATDRYYTQGYVIELVNPVLKKNPLTHTLLNLKNGTTNYGLSFEHYGFTPTSIRQENIQEGNRPFSSFLMFKTFSMAMDTLKKRKLSSALSLGFIGPIAFGEGMQQTIHRWIGDVQPLGWQNQIQNDVVVNYEMIHELQFLDRRGLSLSTLSQLRVGTLNDKAQLGITIVAGKFNSPFGSIKAGNRNKFQLYFYTQPLVSFVAYDASLQGGMFNRSSPYTISNKDINRLTFQENFGGVFSYKKLHLEYFQSFLTKEFRTSTFHRWGGVRIGVSW